MMLVLQTVKTGAMHSDLTYSLGSKTLQNEEIAQLLERETSMQLRSQSELWQRLMVKVSRHTLLQGLQGA